MEEFIAAQYPTHNTASRSRRGRREDGKVLDVVVGSLDLGPGDEEVAVHLARLKHLAHFGEELPLADVSAEQLELVHLLGGSVAVEFPPLEEADVLRGDLLRPLQLSRGYRFRPALERTPDRLGLGDVEPPSSVCANHCFSCPVSFSGTAMPMAMRHIGVQLGS